MTKPYPSRPVRWPLLLMLLLLHGVLLVAMSHQQGQALRVTRTLALRILPPEWPQPRPQTSTRLAAGVDLPLAPRAPLLVPVPEFQISAPAPAGPFAGAAPASAASSPPALRLGLPVNIWAKPHVPTEREQALNDPRANQAKPSVEYRIADAAGTLPVTTSISTDGRDSTLVRQGSKCTRINKPRIATLDPMDARLRDLPAASGACTR
ncbi:MAG: hypothetical protein JO006_03000 [Paucibacter sp.]|nr:hypothetical protein [Roseateles sp.]